MAMKILLLGPSGCGKTTLLAAMKNEFAKQGLPIFLLPKGTTASKLNQKWGGLLQINSAELYEDPPGLLEGTATFETYEFDLKVYEGKNRFPVEIVDIRGGMVEDQDEKLEEYLNQSGVLFHVVDAPAMMELETEKAQYYNAMGSILDLLRKCQSQQNVLVVSILTKCEKYLQRSADKAQMVRRFEEQFEPVLRHVVQAQNIKNLMLTAVQTLGCVHFSRLVTEKSRERFVFVRKKGEIDPKGLEVPLQLAIRHLFQHATNQKPWWTSTWDWFTGEGKKESEALEKFGSEVQPANVLGIW